MKFTPITAALCAACVSVPEAVTQYDLEDPGSIPFEREFSRELVAEAVELANLENLDWELPEENVFLGRGRPFLHAAAMAYAPPVREARARAEAALELALDAGAPGAIDGRVVDHEIGGDDVLLESVVTLDLIGLLGLGPSAAARVVADAQGLGALADLELALWNTRFLVDEHRAELHALSERGELLLTLKYWVEQDLKRIDILDEHGRVAPAQAEVARRQPDRLVVEGAQLSTGYAERQTALAELCGLLLHQVQDPIDGFEVPGAADVRWDESPGGGHPALRAARLSASLAEARLRAIASRTWPGLRLGAHLGWPEGDLSPTRVGGLLGVSIPWPGSYDGRIAAAAVERDRAIERYVEQLHALRVQMKSAEQLRRTALDRLEHAERLEEAAGQAWTATRVRFQNGRATLGEWLDALEMRRGSLFAVTDARLALARAELDLTHALGPREVQP